MGAPSLLPGLLGIMFEAKPAKAFYPHVALPHAQNVSIIVDESLWTQLHPLISQYTDLVTTEHWNVHLEHGSWSSAQELRDHLIVLHDEMNLSGVLLVGDLPSASFEEEPEPSTIYPEDYIRDHWYTGTPPTIPVYQFPTEIFFADLDGAWLDTTTLPEGGAAGGEPNGIYDLHTDPDGAGPADIEPEIWVARVVAPTNVTGYTRSRLQLLEDFFQRACNYHRGLLVQEDHVLIDANAFPHDLDFYSEDVEPLWGLEDQVHLDGSIPDESTNERWVSEIQNSYVHAIVQVHGGGCCYGQEFLERDQGQTYCDYLFYHELRSVEAHVAFYFLDTCKVANFTHPNSMILWYLLGEGDAIVAMGCGTDHGATRLRELYEELGAGKTIGEAFHAFLDVRDFSSGLSGTIDTMVFGDPFYRFREGLAVTTPIFLLLPLSPFYVYATITVTATCDGIPVTTADVAQYLIIDGNAIVRATGELSWTGEDWQASGVPIPLPAGRYRVRCVFESNGRRGISPDIEIIIPYSPSPVIIVPAVVIAIVIVAVPWWWKHSRPLRSAPPPRAALGRLGGW